MSLNVCPTYNFYRLFDFSVTIFITRGIKLNMAYLIFLHHNLPSPHAHITVSLGEDGIFHGSGSCYICTQCQ